MINVDSSQLTEGMNGFVESKLRMDTGPVSEAPPSSSFWDASGDGDARDTLILNSADVIELLAVSGGAEDTEVADSGGAEDTEVTDSGCAEDTEVADSGGAEDTEVADSGGAEDNEFTDSGGTEYTEVTDSGGTEDTEVAKDSSFMVDGKEKYFFSVVVGWDPNVDLENVLTESICCVSVVDLKECFTVVSRDEWSICVIVNAVVIAIEDSCSASFVNVIGSLSVACLAFVR